MNDEELDRLLSAGASRPAASAAAHLDDGVLLAFARGAAADEAVEAHLAACAECRASWLEIKAQLPAAPLGKVRALRPRVWAAASSLAAVAAIAAAFLYFQDPPPRAPLPEYRLEKWSPGLAQVRGGPAKVEGPAIGNYDASQLLELGFRAEETWHAELFEAKIFARAPGRERPVLVESARIVPREHALWVYVRAGELGPPGTRAELWLVVAHQGFDFARFPKNERDARSVRTLIDVAVEGP